MLFTMIALIVVTSFTPALIAQNASSSERIAAEKLYLSTEVRLDSALAPDEFRAALHSARRSGGIVSTVACDVQTPHSVWIPAGSSLASALDTITSLDRTGYWAMHDGVFNILPKQGTPQVMAVTIGHFEWETGASVQLNMQRLFQSDAVRNRLGALGLISELESMVLPQKAPRVIDGHPVPPEPGQRRELENVTLLDALNAVVGSYETAVWSYRERTCGSKKAFRVVVQ